MLKFFKRTAFGIEITSRAVRMGLIRSSGDSRDVRTGNVHDLPPGMMTESFTASTTGDREGILAALRAGFEEFPALKTRRIGLSLPDGLFRVQTLEFDELPPAAADQEKLVRWRLEKSATFDLEGTTLRFQVSERPERGYSVLVCAAKQRTITFFEDLLAELACEVWSVGLSSFHALNFYGPALRQDGGTCAFAWLAPGYYSTIILEQGIPRFYRFREIKPGTSGDAASRVARELDDSLHFYTHRDRLQQSEVERLSLAGDEDLVAGLSGGLSNTTAVVIEQLMPAAVMPSAQGSSGAFAAALGAGGFR